MYPEARGELLRALRTRPRTKVRRSAPRAAPVLHTLCRSCVTQKPRVGCYLLVELYGPPPSSSSSSLALAGGALLAPVFLIVILVRPLAFVLILSRTSPLS